MPVTQNLGKSRQIVPAISPSDLEEAVDLMPVVVFRNANIEN